MTYVSADRRPPIASPTARKTDVQGQMDDFNLTEPVAIARAGFLKVRGAKAMIYGSFNRR